jgi:DNA-binding HxlR family transcriptional regulator
MPQKTDVRKETNAACAAAFEVFGDHWTLMIADALRRAELRFKELQNKLGINSATLTTKLKRLEELKLVERHEETVNKLSVSYTLSPLGKEVLPVLDAMHQFGEKILTA